MMVGRKVEFVIDKKPCVLKDTVLKVENLVVGSSKKGKNSVNNVSFEVKGGEIVCIAGIDGNGQSELAYCLTGLEKAKSGKILFNNVDVTSSNIKNKNNFIY